MESNVRLNEAQQQFLEAQQALMIEDLIDLGLDESEAADAVSQTNSFYGGIAANTSRGTRASVAPEAPSPLKASRPLMLTPPQPTSTGDTDSVFPLAPALSYAINQRENTGWAVIMGIVMGISSRP